MSNPFSKPTIEWPQPPEFKKPESLGKRILNHRLTGLIAVFLFGYFILLAESAPWMKQLTLCMLFCGLIYRRDDSPSDSWITIGIILTGTLLVVLLPLLGIEISWLRRRF